MYSLLFIGLRACHSGKLRLFLSLLIVGTLLISKASAQFDYSEPAQTQGSVAYDLETLPNPKEQGQGYFVSDPNGILDFSTVNELNRIAQQIDSITGAEFAIVLVQNYVGESDFEFALSLFNTWGIGKRETNNGLLLFIAKDRREYRFISGYGMEGIFPDAYLKRVGEKYLVPNFQNDQYDRGILEASHFIEQILLAPDSVLELERMMPEALSFWNWRNPILKNSVFILLTFIVLYLYIHLLTSRTLRTYKNKPKPIAPIFYGIGCMLFMMFISVFVFVFIFDNLEDVYQIKNIPYFIAILAIIILPMKIADGKSIISQAYEDEEDLQNALKKYVRQLSVPIILSPLAWWEFYSIYRRVNNNKDRFTPPDTVGDWVRINRSDPKAISHLDHGQKKEEKLEALRYEIWKDKSSGKIELVPWDLDHSYSSCPKCGYHTFVLDEHRTILAPTYSSSGEGETYDKCHQCKHFVSHGKYTIPRKQRSSSGSSSSSGGGGSSSSSSGSFGGGSSGGGGAGGRW